MTDSTTASATESMHVTMDAPLARKLDQGEVTPTERDTFVLGDEPETSGGRAWLARS